MAETKAIKAVDLVRRIRDEQAEALAGKSDEEVMDFFRSAAERMRVLAAEDGFPPRRPQRRQTDILRMDDVDPDGFLALGLSGLARLLVVVHFERGPRLRIVSARKATTSEEKTYERRHF